MCAGEKIFLRPFFLGQKHLVKNVADNLLAGHERTKASVMMEVTDVAAVQPNGIRPILYTENTAGL